MAAGDNNRGIRLKHRGGFYLSQSLATPATPVRQSEQQQPIATTRGQSCTRNNGEV